jgi:hypothetical protein
MEVLEDMITYKEVAIDKGWNNDKI